MAIRLIKLASYKLPIKRQGVAWGRSDRQDRTGYSRHGRTWQDVKSVGRFNLSASQTGHTYANTSVAPAAPPRDDAPRRRKSWLDLPEQTAFVRHDLRSRATMLLHPSVLP